MNSFLQGKKTLSVAPLRPLAPPAQAVKPASPTKPAAHPSGSAGAADHPNPTVEVVKEGDKVVRLIVICTCGERVEIDCLYPAN